METGLEAALSFVIEIDRMKSILRRSLTFDGSHYENDAEHSWHLAMMAIAFERYAARPVNMERVLKMTLVHDLVEIDAVIRLLMTRRQILTKKNVSAGQRTGFLR